MSICGIVYRAGWQNRIGWYYGLLGPLSTIAIVFTFARSTSLKLRRCGVKWRDHLYPLAELRRHVRDRDLWMRERWDETRKRADPLRRTS